jgi:hypothetical protein
MTRYWWKNLAVLASLLLALALAVGCGGGGGDEQAAEAEQAAPAAEATEVALHDCDGDCGMKDVPVDKMTVVDGKYYCAGCAKKVEGGGHDHDGHDHDGHDH